MNVLMPSAISPLSVLPSVWIINPQCPTKAPPQAITTVSVLLKMVNDGSSLPSEVDPTKTSHSGLCSASFQSDHFPGPGKRPCGGNLSRHNRAIARSSSEDTLDFILCRKPAWNTLAGTTAKTSAKKSKASPSKPNALPTGLRLMSATTNRTTSDPRQSKLMRIGATWAGKPPNERGIPRRPPRYSIA